MSAVFQPGRPNVCLCHHPFTTATKWHAYFGTGSKAVNGVNSIDITTGPPPIVSAIVSGDTYNLGDWQVSEPQGSVQVNIRDNGGRT